MEVADQWRRQWSGAAEYGKVTEGGVTRRIARAMEVLHASAPGARVRVMRAAYHSSAGPGVPASSYLMQSSRQVITSGYNFTQPLSLPTKPMEISSTPFESSSDVDNENVSYKVTEPDDIEISEPSKWRGSTGKSSIRMPSEESSSTDNASIIDLDSRNSSRNTFNRNYRDCDNKQENIKNIHNRNNRVSPLLDAPISLSTLKYTSLLNGSDEWNNRRKSYSFEDTTPLSNNSFSNNDTLVMDSSTDSGICKSTEIVSDHANVLDNSFRRRVSREKLSDLPEESFQDWLYKNRPNTLKSNRVSPFKDYHREQYRTNESNISLQSKGKVTITLPVTLENDDSSQHLSTNSNDCDRKTKKVGFCKTELHFAAESGTVNFIATDEKGPPSNDFRKKRSVFVPFNSRIDKSITLFGEKSNLPDISIKNDISKNDLVDLDENTAVTKGILKNKIPKPKPYLLGENIDFGISNEHDNKYEDNDNTPSAVSAINKNLEPKKFNGNTGNVRTLSSGPQLTNHYKLDDITNAPDKRMKDVAKDESSRSFTYDKNNKPLQATLSGTFKTRQLRDSDLTYFGIDAVKDTQKCHTQDTLQEEILHSVKLVQKVSNSVCNSEAESDDNQDYQNISAFKYSNVPTPKPRTKLLDVTENSTTRILNPIIEGEDHSYRRSKLKKTKDDKCSTNRSISEPPKKEQSYRRDRIQNSSPKRYVVTRDDDVKMEKNAQGRSNSSKDKHGESIYVNVSPHKDKRTSSNTNKLQEKENMSSVKDKGQEVEIKQRRNEKREYGSTKSKQAPMENLKPKRTEILTTPELSTMRTDDSLKQRKIKSKYSDKNNISSHNLSLNSSKIIELSLPDRSKEYKNSTRLSTKKSSKDQEIKNAESSSNSTSLKTNAAVTPVKVRAITRHTSPDKIKSTELNNSASKNSSRQNSSKTRSKYVINYDDKNGTVSSICKMKSGQDSLKKNPNIPTYPKYNSESAVKSKITSKSGFHHQWKTHKSKFDKCLNKREKKSNVYAQKSCQLL